VADFLRMEMGGDFVAELDRLADTVKTTIARTGGNTMAYEFQAEAKAFAPVFAGQQKYIPRSKSGKSGGYTIRPGQLRDSIYRAFSDDISRGDLVAYTVTYNHGKAPHGYWMEFGARNGELPAHPFIRPAYEAAKQRAVQAGIDRMAVKFAELGAAK
jgi:hypothetical protein